MLSGLSGSLAVKIRECADSGNPIVASDPDNPLSMAYLAIAEKIAAQLDAAQKKRKGV